MATQEQLLNIIFDDGSSPQEKSNAVSFLKKTANKDRDALVAQFLNPTVDPAKRKRSPPRERPRPQDAKRIKELEDMIDAVPSPIIFLCIMWRDHTYYYRGIFWALFWAAVGVWTIW